MNRHQRNQKHTTTMTIDRQTIKALRPRINDALKALSDELGIEIKATNGTYSKGETGHFKLEITAPDATGKIRTEAERSWEMLAEPYGFDPADLGRIITIQGLSYAVAGINAKARKNVVVLERGGKKYGCTVEMAKMKLNQPSA